jgi:hypothetical protein
MYAPAPPLVSAELTGWREQIALKWWSWKMRHRQWCGKRLSNSNHHHHHHHHNNNRGECRKDQVLRRLDWRVPGS